MSVEAGMRGWSEACVSTSCRMSIEMCLWCSLLCTTVDSLGTAMNGKTPLVFAHPSSSSTPIASGSGDSRKYMMGDGQT